MFKTWWVVFNLEIISNTFHSKQHFYISLCFGAGNATCYELCNAVWEALNRNTSLNGSYLSFLSVLIAL